jgi:hypothetical protein
LHPPVYRGLNLVVVISSAARDLSDPVVVRIRRFLSEFILSIAEGFEMTCDVPQVPNDIGGILHSLVAEEGRREIEPGTLIVEANFLVEGFLTVR